MVKSEAISVQAELVLTLRNYEDWCSKCPSKLPGKRTPGESFLFVDTNGNTLFSGSDFMEATKRRSYPVKVYRTVNVCNGFYSHSPTEQMSVSELNDPANDDSSLTDFKHLEFDTLQEGDYVENLSKEQYDYLIDLEGDTCVLEYAEGYGLAFYNGILVDNDYPDKKYLTTKLTPEEFLRRAENTFKTK